MHRIIAALLVLGPPYLAGAQAPAPVRLTCPAGKVCRVVASVTASPEVERVCARELARPDKPTPAAAFLACGNVASGRAEFTYQNTGASHVEFVVVAVDDDFKLESAGSDAHGFFPAPLPKPVLEQVAEQITAAEINARDAAAYAERARKLLAVVIAGEEPAGD